jgi:hypothetical protein
MTSFFNTVGLFFKFIGLFMFDIFVNAFLIAKWLAEKTASMVGTALLTIFFHAIVMPVCYVINLWVRFVINMALIPVLLIQTGWKKGVSTYRNRKARLETVQEKPICLIGYGQRSNGSSQ